MTLDEAKAQAEKYGAQLHGWQLKNEARLNRPDYPGGSLV